MRLELLRVAFEGQLTAVIAWRFECLKISVERCLDINDEIPPVRHVHHQIRPQRAVRSCNVLLFGEVAVLGHAGQLHHAAQCDLTPAAAHFRAAQCGDERARFTLQLCVSAGQGFNLRAQACIGVAALALECLRLRLGPLECDPQGFDELADCELLLLEHTCTDDMFAAQGFARHA